MLDVPPGDKSILNTLCKRYAQSRSQPLSGLGVAILNIPDETMFKAHAGLLAEQAGVRRFIVGGMNGEGDVASVDNLEQQVAWLQSMWGGVYNFDIFGGIYKDAAADTIPLTEMYEGHVAVKAIMVAKPQKERMLSIDFLRAVADKTKKPLVLYSSAAAPFQLTEVEEARRELGDQLIGLKNSTGETHPGLLFHDYLSEHGFPNLQHAQGNDRFLEYAFRNQMEFNQTWEQGRRNGIGNISGAANVLPYAHIVSILYGCLAAKRGRTTEVEQLNGLASEIGTYLREEAFKPLTLYKATGEDGGTPRREPAVWKAMAASYVPGLPTTMINKDLVLSVDQQMAIPMLVEAIAAKRNEFVARYHAIRRT